MHLFPDRSDRHGGRFLVIALLLSLMIHLVGGGIWAYFGRHIATAVAHLMPRPTPTPEIVALSDAIKIEKRAVPRVSHRARTTPAVTPHRPRPVVRPHNPMVAAVPVPTAAPVETPRPTHEPIPAPTMHSERATLHRPVAEPTVVAHPEPERTPAPQQRHAFTPEQIAALNQEFAQTIASENRRLAQLPQQGGPSEVRPQREPPASTRQRYQQIMAGTPEQFLAAQGECVPLQGPMKYGSMRAYYIRCTIHYTDGYFEEVSFPWIFRFPARRDPFQYPPGQIVFPMQPPQPGFTLEPNFALSRAVCSFFRAQCNGVINNEIQHGDPSYGKAP